MQSNPHTKNIKLKIVGDGEDRQEWLTQKQLAELFDVTKQNISLHVNRIFKEDELQKDSTVKFFLRVQQERRV